MSKAYERGYEDAMNGRPCVPPYFKSIVARRDYALGWHAAPRRRG
jgi:ribosome modulation factor